MIVFTLLFLIWVIYDVFKAERNEGEAAQKRKPAAKRASRKKPAKKAVKKAVKKKAPKKKS